MCLFEVVWKDMSVFLSMTMLPFISSPLSLMFWSVRCILFTCWPYHVAFTTAQCKNDNITAVFWNRRISVSGQQCKILTVTSGGSNMYCSTYWENSCPMLRGLCYMLWQRLIICASGQLGIGWLVCFLLSPISTGVSVQQGSVPCRSIDMLPLKWQLGPWDNWKNVK